MIYYVKEILDRQTSADRKEFIRGIAGSEKISVRSLAAGVVAGWLLTGGRKK